MNDRLRIPDNLFAKLLGTPTFKGWLFDVRLGEHQRVMWSLGMSGQSTEREFLSHIQSALVEVSPFISLLLIVPLESRSKLAIRTLRQLVALFEIKGDSAAKLRKPQNQRKWHEENEWSRRFWWRPADISAARRDFSTWRLGEFFNAGRVLQRFQFEVCL